MQKNIKPSNLILAAVGPEKPGLLHAMSKLCKTCQCSIIQSHATRMGDTVSVIMQLRGSWNGVAKLEAQLKTFGDKWACQILSHRTDEPVVPLQAHLSYTVQVFTLDRVGVVSDITKFFHQRKIPIQSLSNETYQTSRSPTPMCALNAIVMIPATMNIASLREQFMEYCDAENLDALMEPQKLS